MVHAIGVEGEIERLCPFASHFMSSDSAKSRSTLRSDLM